MILPSLPVEVDGAQMLEWSRGLHTSRSEPAPAPAFIALFEKAVGTGATTRARDTVEKCAAA